MRESSSSTRVGTQEISKIYRRSGEATKPVLLSLISKERKWKRKEAANNVATHLNVCNLALQVQQSMIRLYRLTEFTAVDCHL